MESSKPNGTNFHSSGLRQKIDQLMDILWSGGVNNPMDAIEQLSYLIFLRLLSEKDELFAALDKRNYQRIFSGTWARYAWGNFVTLTGDNLFDAVRSAIESLHELPGLSETGRLLFNRATLKIYDRPTLRAAIQAIHEMDLNPHDGHDIKGDMYEYLLSKISISGRNGQFLTPRHIIRMIVAMVDPRPGLRICDPACGTAGFLIAAFNHILQQNTSKAALAKGVADGDLLKPPQWKFLEQHGITGYDNDANMVKIAILNLYLHRLDKANIEFHNPLTEGKGSPYPGLTFDVILANPPFAGKIQKESILADINLETRDTELLFLKWFIDHLNPGGRAGVIVPNGVLFGSNKADRKVRELLMTSCDLQAMVNLPSGVFKPYSGVGTGILIFEKPVRDMGFQPMTQPHKTKKHGQDDHATVRVEGEAPLKIRQGAYLPHWTREGAIYSVNFRLGDSLPKSVLESWAFEREDIIRTARKLGRELTPVEEKRLDHLFSEKVDQYLDAGHGKCWMRDDAVAAIVAGALKHFEGDRYHVLAWCVMPNHVHVVFRPLPGHELSGILQSWKSYTANEANKKLDRKGEFWLAESYDHLIRDDEDLQRQIAYVVNNPVKAGLKDWKWSGMGFQPMGRKHGQDDHVTSTVTKSVWFYDLTADGFSLDDKRAPIEANDIPDILANWPERREGPNSYRVPIEKIKENDWSLAAGRYKPVTAETVKHDPPAKILNEVLSIEQQIAEQMQKLMKEL